MMESVVLIPSRFTARNSRMQKTPQRTQESFQDAWAKRLQALGNIPAVVKIVWEASPVVVSWGLALRTLTALSPVGLLAIAKVIIDSVVNYISHGTLRPHFWWWVAAEFAVASVSTFLNRTVDFTDVLFADKYVKYISVRIMRHASSLDLATYEEPSFQDKLERARVQATDRLGMIQQMGRLVQQAITTIALASSIVLFSPGCLWS